MFRVTTMSDNGNSTCGSGPQPFGSVSSVLTQWGSKRTYGAVMPKPPATLSGIDHLTNPNLNKGMGFTLHERQILGIHGLLPPCYRDQEKQMQLIRFNVDKFQEPINKYTYLMGVLESNEKLFFRFLSENVEDMMPIIYTPTVGLACQNYGLILKNPRGLFISIHDKGNVLEVLNNWPESNVKAIVVTDGERILGLGDLGAYGMGIPVGKLALFTVLAKVDPRQCLPITLDVGTNNQQLLDDPFYIGLRQKRVTGKEYDNFIDEFMQACVKRFGRSCLIQFEDFANHNAFRFLDKYREEYCTFNDDIQGTAAVCVAGVLASLRATKTRLSDHVIVFQGAGEASLGIAELCVRAMKNEGTAESDARSKIWLVDSKGLIVANRPEGGISEHKAKFAHQRAPIKTLAEVVRTLKPSILIGAAAIGGAFTPEILQTMAINNKQPVIFALSNPTSKAECTAEAAYENTNGTCLFASGSPFLPYTHNGKTHYPGQGNNSYIFPGVALGVISAGIRHINEELFLLSAQSLANIVTEEDLENGSLYPPLKHIQSCSLKIAVKLVEAAYEKGHASVYPEPEDKEAFIRALLYDYHYTPAVPKVYDWPSNL